MYHICKAMSYVLIACFEKIIEEKDGLFRLVLVHQDDISLEKMQSNGNIYKTKFRPFMFKCDPDRTLSVNEINKEIHIEMINKFEDLNLLEKILLGKETKILVLKEKTRKIFTIVDWKDLKSGNMICVSKISNIIDYSYSSLKNEVSLDDKYQIVIRKDVNEKWIQLNFLFDEEKNAQFLIEYDEKEKCFKEMTRVDLNEPVKISKFIVQFFNIFQV